MSNLHRANAIFNCSGALWFAQEPGSISDFRQKGPGRGSETVAAGLCQPLLEFHCCVLFDQVDGRSAKSSTRELSADEAGKSGCRFDKEIQLVTRIPEKVTA